MLKFKAYLALNKRLDKLAEELHELGVRREKLYLVVPEENSEKVREYLKDMNTLHEEHKIGNSVRIQLI